MLEAIEVSTDWEPHPSEDSAPWGDTVGVFKKPLSHQLKPDAKIQKLTKKLRQTQEALAEAQSRIAAMETSKFWKLRESWFQIKRILRLPSNE